MRQVEILDFESTMTEMKLSLEGLTIRFEQEEERISKLSGRSVDIISSESIKEKKNEEK